jgi:hypothetical protein
MNGWFRLAVFLSGLWVCGVLLFAAYEYHSISRGGSPRADFVHLRDSKTGADLGRLSMSEVKEFGELAQKKSRSPAGDQDDAAIAKRLLAAEPEPFFHYLAIFCWSFIPLVCFWVVFIGVRWVAAGFRKTA